MIYDLCEPSWSCTRTSKTVLRLYWRWLLLEIPHARSLATVTAVLKPHMPGEMVAETLKRNPTHHARWPGLRQLNNPPQTSTLVHTVKSAALPRPAQACHSHAVSWLDFWLKSPCYFLSLCLDQEERRLPSRDPPLQACLRIVPVMGHLWSSYVCLYFALTAADTHAFGW